MRAVTVAMSGTALLVWLRWRRPAVLFAVAAVDLLLALGSLKQQNQVYVDEDHERLVRRALEAEGLLVAGLPPPRVFIPEPFRENAGMLYGWSTPYGYSALAPGRVWNYMHESLGVAPPVDANTFPSLSLANRGPWPYDSMALVAGVDPRTLHLARNPHPDPRAYVATGIEVVRDANEAISRMRAGHDFHRVALVERQVILPVQTTIAGTAVITRFDPERVVVTAQTATSGLVILAEPWFPGWTAHVNGVPSPCFPVNAWMRGVVVPQGASEVVFAFHSTYLHAGALLSAAALLLVLGMLVGMPFRRSATR